MRTLFITILLANFVTVSAQDAAVISQNPLYIDDLPFTADGKLVFQEVVPAEHDQAKLYLLSKMFFTKVFKSADDVVQFDDKETATVIGKGFSDITIQSMGYPVTTRMFYTITVQCKDKRYRYEISDIYYKSYPTADYPSVETPADLMFLKSNYYKKNGKARPLIESYRDQTWAAVSSLIEQLVDTMNFTKPVGEW